MWILVALQVIGVFGCQTDANHERQALKTRSAPPSSAGASARTLAQVFDWAIPAGHTDAEQNAIKPREPKLYQLTGFVRKIKRSRSSGRSRSIHPS
jgi:hypothetical protein